MENGFISNLKNQREPEQSCMSGRPTETNMKIFGFLKKTPEKWFREAQATEQNGARKMVEEAPPDRGANRPRPTVERTGPARPWSER